MTVVVYSCLVTWNPRFSTRIVIEEHFQLVARPGVIDQSSCKFLHLINQVIN